MWQWDMFGDGSIMVVLPLGHKNATFLNRLKYTVLLNSKWKKTT